jgi:hypothetical protein
MGRVASDGGAVEVSGGRTPLEPGTEIEVRNRFDRSWSTGFEVAEIVDGRYRILRLSDGSTLPEMFDRDDVRRRRRPRQGFWWR